jgi:anti-sigma regulatory factor (Ser/Thr protein kinase)
MAEQRSFNFRSRPEAVSAARRALDGLDSFLDAAAFYDASLCVSELVTNAVLHADIAPEDELRLDVSIDDGGSLRVTVTDSGRGFDPPAASGGDESGWGLFIVDRLSDRWGVERGQQTRVWFEMGTRAAQREDPGDEHVTASAGREHDDSAPASSTRKGRMARFRVGAQTSS